ncbi:xanthine dehydrogenase family protein molybdopterin-binding subunit [Streptacidiphilus sp. ASG 303]|uniref:xanthine dehydrogenase family protein molybdopterin-binding subunit n=1 Tax=Streptacidiphilus sp. ASG 303 TaxID=2896847 RepID=UPI001E5139E8|nr:xanthine dehydrogenase family protein molybdopterin-binding subunit [Streptacidiphilus sp. ASG 303]MCD0485101.1 xanthine dehydrogenase family protein molybdopterin-binding subunit [Streptacidiphilus sp. ASG 303]
MTAPTDTASGAPGAGPAPEPGSAAGGVLGNVFGAPAAPAEPAAGAAAEEAAPEPEPFGLGSSPVRQDALPKALGVYPYAADLWAEGLLWGAVLRSPHPHARIVSVDASAALALPGVHAVVTAADLPSDHGGRAAGAPHGPVIADRPVLAAEVVRHQGEPVAAVAADHPDTARLAAAAVAVEYEVLEPVTDPEKSFHAGPLHPDGNLFRHLPLRFGDPDAVGDVVVEGLYQVGRQDPAPIGAEAGLAVPRPDGGVELHVASTNPHGDRDRAAACLGLEPDRVRLVVTGVPGATADREDLSFQVTLALLALRTGRPVKMALGREDSFHAHAHRHPALLRYRHHADSLGHLVKVEAQILLDGGAYADVSSEALAAAAAFSAGPYVVPHVFVDAWAVRTNNPPAGRMRGEGALQACFAYESQLDKLAAKLGVDPLEIRRRNAMATGDLMPTGQAVTCPAPVGALLDAVAAEPLPPLPVDEPDTEWLLPGGPHGAGDPAAVRRGIGYAVGMVHMLGAEGADEVSTATVRVSGEQATVICAAVDAGQGFATLARQVVQDVLGVTDVWIAPVDTDQPAAGPTARGRQTWVSGGAVEKAALMVRHQLLQPIAANFGMSPELLQIADGKITSYDGVLGMPVSEALEGKELWATAQCRPHPTEPLDDAGQGDAFVSVAFCAMRAVVDVDIELGAVRVVDVTVAQDVGRALNPRQIEARIEAGVTQGVGLALLEELQAEDGRLVNPSFTGYRLPTALDTPEVRIAALLEERDVVASFGAKAVGAAPAVVAPAAVAAAVRAATGRPVTRLPVRPQDAVV